MRSSASRTPSPKNNSQKNTPSISNTLTGITDNRAEARALAKAQNMVANSPRTILQRQVFAATNRKHDNENHGSNVTGMPDKLKAGIEHFSKSSMDDVTVHYNSPRPVQLNAHAYAQGTHIHIAPGQEEHLAHEAWHVVQQKQGRVNPTMQVKNIPINDDKTLEKEAESMGAKANAYVPGNTKNHSAPPSSENQSALSSPVQLFKDPDKFLYDLDRTFKAKTWKEFYEAQEAFQQTNLTDDNITKKDPQITDQSTSSNVNDDTKGKGEGTQKETTLLDDDAQHLYTTFGMEYEMLPYKHNSPISNTAHIKLAEGAAMPIKPDYKEALVTDSDNIIEYVSPVFILPLMREDTYTNVPQYIALVRSLLTNLRKELPISKTGSVPFAVLLADRPMTFTRWTIKNSLDITFREIDENTNIKTIKSAMGWGPHDIAEILVGYDQKVDKHKTLKNNEVEGSAMQSTVMLPLDVVAQIVRKSMARSEKTVDNNRNQKKAQPSKRGKENSEPVTSTHYLLEELLNNRGLEKNSTYGNLVHLFVQRLTLILENTNAVKYQAFYQYLKFNEKSLDNLDTTDPFEKSIEEDKVGYREQQDLYDQTVDKSTLKNNFHSAHSFIKDDISIWTRVYLDDLILNIYKITNSEQAQYFTRSVLDFKPVIDNSKCNTLLRSLLQSYKYDDLLNVEHESVHFLEENEELPDLRQDTLRNVVIRNGRPWVLVEIRDLKDKPTLKNLVKHIKE